MFDDSEKAKPQIVIKAQNKADLHEHYEIRIRGHTDIGKIREQYAKHEYFRIVQHLRIMGPRLVLISPQAYDVS